jgi:hypothetical protein
MILMTKRVQGDGVPLVKGGNRRDEPTRLCAARYHEI